MKLVTYAEVLTSDHPLYRAYLDGFKKTPGHLLGDVLTATGGRYSVSSALPDRVVTEIQAATAGITDALALSAIRTKSVQISLEHLRGHDPATTRIVYGYRLMRDQLDGP